LLSQINKCLAQTPADRRPIEITKAEQKPSTLMINNVIAEVEQ
jgi:hypothetical protein